MCKYVAMTTAEPPREDAPLDDEAVADAATEEVVEPVEEPEPVQVQAPTTPTMLIGPVGPRGIMGPRGRDGRDGRDGKRGPIGLRGPIGIAGPPGRIINDYAGQWVAGNDYAAGAIVTHKGSSWIAVGATAEEPGRGSGWAVLASRGRDGMMLSGAGGSGGSSDARSAWDIVVPNVDELLHRPINSDFGVDLYSLPIAATLTRAVLSFDQVDGVDLLGGNASLGLSRIRGEVVTELATPGTFDLVAKEEQEFGLSGSVTLQPGDIIRLDGTGGVIGDNGQQTLSISLGDGTAPVLLWANPQGSGSYNAWYVRAVSQIIGGGDWTAGTVDIVKELFGVDPQYDNNSVLADQVDLDGPLVFEVDADTNRLVSDVALWAVFDSPNIGAGSQPFIRITLSNTQGPRGLKVQLTFEAI